MLSELMKIDVKLGSKIPLAIGICEQNVFYARSDIQIVQPINFASQQINSKIYFAK